MIDRLVRMGIPVMGHLGLTPQAVHRLGYRRQATDAISQERLVDQARTLEQKGQAIAVLTAWDSLSAALAEAAGADVVLIGDSLAMVALGHATTLPVSLDQMLHHTQAVARGLTAMPADQPLLVCDLPFLSYQCGEDRAVAAAGRLLKESSAAAVKLEGA